MNTAMNRGGLFNRHGPRALVCEAKVPGHGWREYGVNHVLELDRPMETSCPECHGAVRPNGSGAEAFFEHHDEHDGCSFAEKFGGVKRRHPHFLD